MTRSGFTVETRGQGAVILGGGSDLGQALIQEFLLLSVQALQTENLGEVTELSQTHDLDYVLCFGESISEDLLLDLDSRLKSGESRLILLTHVGDPVQNPFNVPPYKHLIYSDYVGAGELVCNTLSAWLKHLSIKHDLILPSDGLSEVSLLGLSDLAHLIAVSTIAPLSSLGEQIELGNPDFMSLLNLAYLVRTNLDFKISLKFEATLAPDSLIFDQSTYASTLNRFDYHLSASLEEILKSYLQKYFASVAPLVHEQPKTMASIPPAEPIKKIPVSPKPAPAISAPAPDPAPKKLTPLKTAHPVFVPLSSRRTRPSFKSFKFKLPRPKTVVAKGLLIALALYVGTLAFSATIVGLSLKSISAASAKGELPPTSTINSYALTYLRANWVAMTSFPGISHNQTVSDISLLFDGYSQTLAILDTTKQLSATVQDLIHYVFGSGNSDIANLVSYSRLQSEDLYQKLSLLDGTLPSDPPAILGSKYSDFYKKAKSKLGELKHTVITAKAVLATTPDLIGLGGRRKYGVLFQNNMELRATGGFIGSFAILSFENGKLYDMPIYDVYDADGQLKGHVEPPAPIKNILGEANWYLRDSNFDPDFPTSARRAEWFIKKTLNQDLDGTVGVNVSTLADLLGAVGPLEVSDYNETITASNLYERSQFHAEVNFFPGSTQKKEFLSTVANALFAKLPSLGGGDGLKLVEALSKSVDEKNTLISLTSPGSNHVFETLGWTGSLTDFPCPTASNCHKDYAMVVDSNFGVNKANYFIKRAIEEVITFDKNLSVSHTLKLHYQNTSTSTAWPAGAYKNYQRVYLPVGSNIQAIKVGDKSLTASEYTVSAEHDKMVVGYLATVPISSNLDIEINYSTPQLPQDKELFYTWYWQKQPGTSADDSVTVYLNYPLYLKPIVVAPVADLSPQQLKFGLVNDTDHRITVKFTK